MAEIDRKVAILFLGNFKKVPKRSFAGASHCMWEGTAAENSAKDRRERGPWTDRPTNRLPSGIRDCFERRCE